MTSQRWNSSLRDDFLETFGQPQLPYSVTGSNGNPGKDGKNGVNGAPGAQGPAGRPGKDGHQGPGGATGPIGKPGPQVITKWNGRQTYSRMEEEVTIERNHIFSLFCQFNFEGKPLIADQD